MSHMSREKRKEIRRVHLRQAIQRKLRYQRWTPYWSGRATLHDAAQARYAELRRQLWQKFEGPHRP